MVKEESDMATSKSDLAKSNRRKKCASSNSLPVAVDDQTNLTNTSGEIIMYQPDETISLEVRMGEESVWLTQQQMAELFSKDRTDIGRHIRNIYKEGELEKDITCAKFAHMGSSIN